MTVRSWPLVFRYARGKLATHLSTRQQGADGHELVIGQGWLRFRRQIAGRWRHALVAWRARIRIVVREIRHLGLMIGIQLKEKVTPVLKDLLSRGVLALPAGSTVLRLLPPLTITDEEMDVVEAEIAAVLKA